MKLIYFLAILNFLGFSTSHDPPLVRTPFGAIQGYYKQSYYNNTYSAFEGIPYAEPPTGDLRFEESVPAKAWEGVLIANQTYECLCFLPIPVIFGNGGTEDCLYLYIYVPRAKINPNDNLDVCIHIHGGIFMYGSPALIAGPDYMMDHDVIFVSFNFRSGLLGFLSTEDDVVPGNNGLKDQVLALKWIKDNIKYFGGNPNSITLTGLSSGAISVQYHYLSPLSRGLFHRGFSQSGTVLVSWALAENSLNKAKSLATYLKCTTNTTKLMVDCLKQLDGQELMNGVQSLYVYQDAVPFPLFGPVVDKCKNPFLPDHPYKLLRNGQVYDVPWICSNTKHEGIYPVGIFVFLNLVDEINERWDELMPYMLDYYGTVNESDWKWVAGEVKRFYFKDQPSSIENIYTLIKMFSERLYHIDSEKSIRMHAAAVKSPVYYYFYEYILQLSFLFANGMDFKKGTSHTDDGRLMIKLSGSPDVFEETDEKMMNLLTEFLANYCKTGKPVVNNVEWQPLDKQSKEINYLNIVAPDNIRMKKMMHVAASDEFWKSLPIRENEKLFQDD